MPGRYLGENRVRKRYLGAQRIMKRYLGDTLIWEDGTLLEMFDGPRSTLQSIGWTDLGPDTSFKLSQVNGMCRVDLGDNPFLLDQMSTSRARMPGTTGDNGYFEVRIGSKGNGTPPLFSNATYTTEVLRRANNTGTTISGVGLAFRESRAYIVRYVSGTRTEVVSLGAFAVHDVFRFKSAGNLHTVYRNGSYFGEWDDSSGTVNTGSAYRSIIVRGDASKKLLDMRRFSPALDYIEAA